MKTQLLCEFEAEIFKNVKYLEILNKNRQWTLGENNNLLGNLEAKILRGYFPMIRTHCCSINGVFQTIYYSATDLPEI